MENVARLGLILDTTDFRRSAVDSARSLDQVKASAGGVMQGLSALQKVIQGVAAAWAAMQIGQRARELIDLAARYETLGVVLKTVGNAAGSSAFDLSRLQSQLMKTGISMIAARQTMVQFIQSNLRLADATKLARVAQDAAVVANQNSSDTLLQIVHAVQSGQNRILQTIGMNVSWERSYESLARSMHKTADELTPLEKVQARVNAVMEAGKPLTGAYTSAMDTAGKQMQSMKRYAEDLKVNIGTIFLPVYTKAVFGMADALKWLNQHLGVTIGIIAGAGTVAGILAFASAIKILGGALAILGVSGALALPVISGVLALAGLVGVLTSNFFDQETAARKATAAIREYLQATEISPKNQIHYDPKYAGKDYMKKWNVRGMAPPALPVKDPNEGIDPDEQAKAMQAQRIKQLELMAQRAKMANDVVAAEKLERQAVRENLIYEINASKALNDAQKKEAIARALKLEDLKSEEKQVMRNWELQREIQRGTNNGNRVSGQETGTGNQFAADARANQQALLYAASQQALLGQRAGTNLPSILQGATESGVGADSANAKRAKQQRLAEQWKEVWLQAARNIQTGVADVFQQLFEGQIASLRAFGNALLKTVSRIFSQIAAAYVTSGIFNILLKAGVKIPGGKVPGVSAEVNHLGGVAGNGSNVRIVDPSMFLNAYRYHRGGVAGLAPDEVPSILKRGERIQPVGHKNRDDRPTVQVNQNVNFNLSAVDGVDAQRFIQTNAGHIAGVVLEASAAIPGYRRAMGGR